MKRPDHHNEIELNFLRRGSLTYLLAGSKVRVEAGQLAAFWASIPHQIVEFEKSTDYFVVTIPFAEFMLFKLPDAFVRSLLHGVLHREGLGSHQEFEWHRFSVWESDLSTNREEVRETVLLELEARLRRMAQNVDLVPPLDGRHSRAALPDGSLNKVEQIACFIAQNYLEHLTAERIAGAVGVHPNYAMNLFKKAFGTTLLDYLAHHRVSHAQRLLVTTEMKILDVAMASGFHTLSRFNEVFHHTCGCSPKVYRAEHRS